MSQAESASSANPCWLMKFFTAGEIMTFLFSKVPHGKLDSIMSLEIGWQKQPGAL